MSGKGRIWIFSLLVAGLTSCGTDSDPGPKDDGETDASAITGAVNSLDKADSSLGAIWQGPLGFDVTVETTLDGSLPLHAWTVEAGDGARAYIELTSDTGGDTFLLLYARNANDQWTAIAGNDDCTYYTRSACLQHTFVGDGEFLVVATTYDYMRWRDRPTADYELTVHCDSLGGECEPVIQGQPCGVWNLPACPTGEYCDYPDDYCGAADRAGVCQPKPDACTQEYAPVCACGGQTYSNACMAAAAGVDVSALCDPDAGQQAGEICGGIAGFQCAQGLVCDMSNDNGCYADAAGTCVQEMEILCTQEYAPVCGCDGVTYSNDCMRRAARVALDHTGEC